MTQPWVTLVVGLVAAFGVIATLFQKHRADNRREWWARFAWAIDATYSTNPHQRRDGWRVITILAQSNLITKSERPLIAELIMNIGSDVVANLGAGVMSKEDAGEQDNPTDWS
ncbi:MAG: hypothetical protein QM658_11285 [Gordonia sp. (in: high G+C Gram-positive bacteria)]